MSRNVLGMESIVKGSKNRHYKNKIIVMKAKTLALGFKEDKFQLWLATGGFGCDPEKIGTAVYAICLADGEKARWNRNDFHGVYNGKLTEKQYAMLEDILQPTIEGLEKRLEAGQEIGVGGWKYELEGDSREAVIKELNGLHTLFAIYGGGE